MTAWLHRYFPNLFCVAVVLLAVFTLEHSAVSQLPTATILGTVKDSTGALVPGAAVTVRNLDTALTRTENSGAAGSFRFVALPVGSYEVRAEHPGFRAELRNMTLVVGQEAVVNFALQVGAIEQTVEVTAEAPLVNTTSGTLGSLVGEKQVSNLPLNGRNYVDLTLLQPGVVQHRQNSISALGPGTWFSANGAPPRSNWYMLDGAPIGNAWGGTTSSANSATLGIEGIREWRVVTNSFGAEYGMRIGGQMTIVSKGGTNNFHGSAFEFLRNSALDARNFFDYQTVASNRRLPSFKRNQFGASFGGPIKKDKVFFFSTYEGLRQRLGVTTIDNVIPAASKVNGGVVPQIAPQILPLLTLFPTPNLPGNRFTFPSNQPVNDDYGQARGDLILSARDAAFVRYTNDRGDETDPLSYPQFQRVRQSQMHFVTASDTHTFSSALVGTSRFSFSRSRLAVDSPTTVSGPQFSFVPGLTIGQIGIGAVTTLGTDNTTPNGHVQDAFSASADLFYAKGRHSLKFGTLINHFDDYLLGGLNYRGTVSFANIQSFLLGQTVTYSAITPGSVLSRDFTFSTLGFYFQDDLRATSNLTLNLGLRYEINTDFNEVNNHGSALRDIRHDAAFVVGLPFTNPSLHNFGPRLGFAWDVMGDGRMAVRGGYGLMFDVANYGAPLLLQAIGAPPFSTQSAVPTPATLAVPFFFPASALGKSVRTIDYHLRNPHMETYNLTVERQLPSSMSVSVTYAGSRGLNLMQNLEGNPAVPQVLSTGQFFWTGTEPRINPNWTAVQYHTGTGDSWYNSLQLVVTKRLTKGLQFQSAFTWQKLLDDKLFTSTDDNGGSQPILSVVLPRKMERGLADWNASRSWRFNALYNLPQISGAGSFLKGVLNGWAMSGILSLQTGLPFTPTLTSNRSHDQLGAEQPNLNPGRKNSNIILGGPNLYFDPLAFSVQPSGFLGNVGRNILTGPGLANLDFSLVKNTSLKHLGEAGKLEFRAEFFNILNRANFARPSSVVFAGLASGEAPLPTAGQITGTITTARQIQIALKIVW